MLQRIEQLLKDWNACVRDQRAYLLAESYALHKYGGKAPLNALSILTKSGKFEDMIFFDQVGINIWRHKYTELPVYVRPVLSDFFDLALEFSHYDSFGPLPYRNALLVHAVSNCGVPGIFDCVRFFETLKNDGIMSVDFELFEEWLSENKKKKLIQAAKLAYGALPFRLKFKEK